MQPPTLHFVWFGLVFYVWITWQIALKFLWIAIKHRQKQQSTDKTRSFNLEVEPASCLSLTDICSYKKVCPFNGSTPMIQSNTSDFHFSWNQMPNAIGRLPRQPCLGPTRPMLLTWPGLAVAMETPHAVDACVATSIQLANVIICMCTHVYTCLVMKSKYNWY